MKTIAIAGILLWSLACASAYEGRVVGISDGDTVTVLINGSQIRVRLAEIDAPEKRQAYGQRSKQSLSDLAYGKRVKVTQQDLDRYGRVVGRIYTESLDVNAEQIKRGMAWVYRKYNRDKSLLALEQEARAAKRGLWSDLDPVPPWEYRQGGVVAAHLCGEKRYCSEMGSCEEAKRYLGQCGLGRLDGDGDGLPCESLCSQAAPAEQQYLRR